MLHSGSRGVGNAIGSYFIERAKEDMRRYFINLPDADLAYLPEGSETFDDYFHAVEWAQRYAMTNRDHHDAARGGGAARRDPEAVRDPSGSRELPPQLRGARASFRRERARDPQGRGAGGQGRDGDHSGVDGRQVVHRARKGLRGQLLLVLPRGGAGDVARPRPSAGSPWPTMRRPPRAWSAARTKT